MGKENTIFKNYAAYIFSFFNHCNAPGQGLFLLRTLEASARKEGKTQIEINNYKLVFFNLFENGYFTMPNEPMPFVKLTEKGYDYLQGDTLISNVIELSNYIDSSKNDVDSIFRQLWDIIGKPNEAPFYVDGTTFFNAIYPYIKNLPGTYSTFMEELKEKGLSTSRITWYRELLKKIEFANISHFLHDLSSAINKYYKETLAEENSDFEEFLSTSNSPNSMTSSPISIIKTLPPKKSVFITYCWEEADETHIPWVHKLGEDLDKEGFDILIDVKQPLGIELNKFMEQTIANVDKVLIIATPEYKRRADNRERGVGYETSLITDDLIKDQNKIKFIPIIRKGKKENCYPNYLGNRKGLSMKEEDDYKIALKELVDNIKNYQ